MLDRISTPTTADLDDVESPRRGRAAGNLVELIRLVIRNLVWIIAPVFLALAITAVYLATASPRFTAQTQLLIDARLPQVLQLGEMRMLLDRSEIDSQIALILSEHIGLMVLRGLKDSPDSNATNSPSGAKTDGALRVSDAKWTRRALAAFQAGLEVRRLGVSYVIEISYTSDKPEKSALLSNAIAEAYIEDQLVARGAAVAQGSKWLEQRIDELRVQMNESALKVQAFKARRDYRIVNTEAAPAPANRAEPAAAAPQASLEELESTAQTYRKIYESYMQAFTESVQRQSYPIANARIISRAEPPLTRSHPKVLKWLVLAGAVGALCGIGIALLREALRSISEANSGRSVLDMLTAELRSHWGRRNIGLER